MLPVMTDPTVRTVPARPSRAQPPPKKFAIDTTLFPEWVLPKSREVKSEMRKIGKMEMHKPEREDD